MIKMMTFIKESRPYIIEMNA